MRFLRAFAPAPLCALLLTADQPPLAGEYKWELDVAGMDGSLVATGAITPTTGKEFTGKFTMDTPFQVEFEVKGRQWADSVEINLVYNDKTNSCSGTMKARGVVADSASKAEGPLSLVDSCRGAADAAWRLHR